MTASSNAAGMPIDRSQNLCHISDTMPGTCSALKEAKGVS